MRRGLIWIAALVAAAVCLGLAVTWPVRLPGDHLEGLTGDVDRGARVFALAGCASCHAAPDATHSDRPILSGGQRFTSDFGTFVAPNISPNRAAGIGGWSQQDFANAVMRGVSPEGRHYYPAFPYAAYERMAPQDLVDLWAFVQTLPGSDQVSAPHEVGFPFNIRRGVGLWKLRYTPKAWVADAPTDQIARGRYIAEALAHCGECHTPRDALGGLDRDAWLTGAPNPSGRGRIPGITPAQLDWLPEDVAYYLETGFTPDFDSAGGSMAKVVNEFASVPAEDRAAVAAYLASLSGN